MAMISFRDSARRIVPRWLRNGLAQRLLYAIGIHFDLVGDATASAVRRRFPGQDFHDSLGILGRERRIRRGAQEPNESYAGRLIRWLDDHAVRGGPYALLEQVGAYYAANPFEIALVYPNGTRYTRAVDGTITRDTITFNPPGGAAEWARWWLFYDWPTAFGDDGLWGDGGLNELWGDGGVWATTLTPLDVADLRLVPSEWNAAHVHRAYVCPLYGGGQLWGYPPGLWGAEGGLWGDGEAIAIPVT
jgi:hypothetical protein